MMRVRKNIILQKKENVMVVKKKGLYLGLLASLLGIGNVMQAYKLTIKNETGYGLRVFIDYDGDCKLYKKKLRNGKTTTIKPSCAVKQVSARVYTRPGKVYGEKGVFASAYYISPGESGMDDMTFVIGGNRRGFQVTRE